MVKILGNQNNCYHQMPFAMFFAVEPAFTSISTQDVKEDLRYNPLFQVNDESRLAITLGGSTSTSIKGTTFTNHIFVDDDDSMGDESQ